MAFRLSMNLMQSSFVKSPSCTANHRLTVLLKSYRTFFSLSDSYPQKKPLPRNLEYVTNRLESSDRLAQTYETTLGHKVRGGQLVYLGETHHNQSNNTEIEDYKNLSKILVKPPQTQADIDQIESFFVDKSQSESLLHGSPLLPVATANNDWLLDLFDNIDFPRHLFVQQLKSLNQSIDVFDFSSNQMTSVGFIESIFHTRWMMIDDFPLAWQFFGNPKLPMVLLIHHFNGNMLYQSPYVVKSLVDKGYCVVMIDLPNSGRSGTISHSTATMHSISDKIAKFLDTLEKESFNTNNITLLGQSIGAYLNLYLFLSRPDKYRQWFAINTLISDKSIPESLLTDVRLKLMRVSFDVEKHSQDYIFQFKKIESAVLWGRDLQSSALLLFKGFQSAIPNAFRLDRHKAQKVIQQLFPNDLFLESQEVLSEKVSYVRRMTIELLSLAYQGLDTRRIQDQVNLMEYSRFLWLSAIEDILPYFDSPNHQFYYFGANARSDLICGGIVLKMQQQKHHSVFDSAVENLALKKDQLIMGTALLKIMQTLSLIHKSLKGLFQRYYHRPIEHYNKPKLEAVYLSRANGHLLADKHYEEILKRL